jgi:hypothetical protein
MGGPLYTAVGEKEELTYYDLTNDEIKQLLLFR